jgi:activating signal cointegrator 1
VTKALTICQPYAELIMRGDKPIENRTWPTAHRGDLVIHAGKSRDWLDPDDEAQYPDMPFGALVGIAKLVACLDYEAKWPEQYRHLHNHEHANGPYCWILEGVVRFRQPVPYRGAQGLWAVDLFATAYELSRQRPEVA